MSYQRHPGLDVLQRFVQGEVTRQESREVVRHLLQGCPECAKAVWPIWGWPAEARA